MFRSLTLLAAGVVTCALAGNAKADDDLVRLDGKGDAEVQEARYYGGGGFRAGYGGYAGRGYGYGGGFYRGGYGGGWGRGYYGGWGRGYYGGWGRGYYGGGWGRSYYGIGLGWGGYYGGGYYGGYYSQPVYSYYSSPCTCSAPIVSDTTVTLSRSSIPQNPGDGTFPYDGGPRDGFLAPVPAGIQNRSTAPKAGLLVSAPAPSSGYQFPAFGELPVEPAPRPLVVNNQETLRVSYPAFGEPMPNFTGFSGGSTDYRIALR